MNFNYWKICTWPQSGCSFRYRMFSYSLGVIDATAPANWHTHRQSLFNKLKWYFRSSHRPYSAFYSKKKTKKNFFSRFLLFILFAFHRLSHSPESPTSATNSLYIPANVSIFIIRSSTTNTLSTICLIFFGGFCEPRQHCWLRWRRARYAIPHTHTHRRTHGAEWNFYLPFIRQCLLLAVVVARPISVRCKYTREKEWNALNVKSSLCVHQMKCWNQNEVLSKF